jgi:hypothetical protein
MRKIIVLGVVMCFCLCSGLASADQYLVVKDKSGKCKVEVFRSDKGMILAGPFDSKDQGMKALQEKCPESAKKPAEKKPEKK